MLRTCFHSIFLLSDALRLPEVAVAGCFYMGFFFKTLSLLYLDQEQRVKSVMIGRLSPGDSFGEITVLKGLPMPCSVITDTHVQIGTISTLDVHGRYFDTSSPPSQPSPDQLSPLPSSLPLIRRLSLRFTVSLDLFHTRRF